MNAHDIAALIESVAPIESGMGGDELGFIHGDAAARVHGVVTCWSPTLSVLRRANELGANLICSHEALFFQKRWSVDAEARNVWFEEADDGMKPVNAARRAELDRNGAIVYRAHSNWDLAPEIGVLDAVITVLELGPPVARGAFTTLHDLAPITVRALAERVRDRLDTGAIRVTGAPERVVTRVGTLIGGLGQMFNAPEELARLGAEAVIAGECLAYTLHNAEELGLALIEAGHCATENPGMRAMADYLAARLPDLPVHFLDTARPWALLANG